MENEMQNGTQNGAQNEPETRDIPVVNPTPAVNTTPTPAPYAAGTGSAQLLPDRAALTRMSYRERLALKRTDPEGYKALREK